MTYNILVLYWGRKGAISRYTLQILNGFKAQSSARVFASFSKQCEIFSEMSTKDTPSYHIDTFGNKYTFTILNSLKFPLKLIGLLGFIKKNNIQRVYITVTHPWLTLLIPLLVIIGVDYVITVHDGTPHPGDPRIIYLLNKHFLLRKAHKIVVLSKYVGKQLINHYGIKEEKIIHSDLGEFNYPNLPVGPKKFEGVPFRIIFYGRILPYKGIEYLLSACIELQKEFDFTLEIYGQGDLKPYQSLIQQINGIKIVNRWIKDEEVCHIFSSPCINVCPYIEASQSGTIPIALSCGIPTICTNVGGLGEQIVHEETGIVIDIENVVANLKQAIYRLNCNREFCSKMSIKCAAFAREKLNWTHLSKEILEKLYVS